jgi:hypothetical protein
MNRRWLLCMLMSAACAGGKTSTPSTPAKPAAPDPGLSWRGDTTLARVLAVMTLGRRELALSDTLASLDDFFDIKLAALVSDSTAPPLIRTNAILLLADRRVPNLMPYLNALEDPDERVRAAAIVGLKNDLAESRALEGLVKAGLDDPSRLVQAKALEALADLDVATLHAYLARTKDPTLRKIALDLLSAAENRGAPLEPKDSTGRLERAGPEGRTVVYRPSSRWPNWDASAGDLFIVGPKRDTTRIGNVEVVGNVLPAFFSIDGHHLVYEAAREIHVRDLQTGADRVVGAGIAPRLLPFSETFVFLRQKGAPVTQGVNTAFKYEVTRGSFTEPRNDVVGELTANSRFEMKGYYSPARWMRVRESGGSFFLFGDGIELFKLPDPFAVK